MLHQRYITIIVLIVGVFGGLGVLTLFIICYKHCTKSVPQTG